MSDEAPVKERKPKGKKIIPAKLRGAIASAVIRSTSAKLGGAKRTRRKRPGPARGKYNARGRRVDGRWFASSSEATRYEQLKELLAQGRIENLECQPRYPVRVNNRLICTYVADFRYEVIDDHGKVLSTPVEDVKGMMTPTYKIKQKLMQAVYGIELVEIPARDINHWAGRLP